MYVINIKAWFELINRTVMHSICKTFLVNNNSYRITIPSNALLSVKLQLRLFPLIQIERGTEQD